MTDRGHSVTVTKDRTILFVCTGNTCRSPMAEAIARDLLTQRPIDEPVVIVASAGVSATDGEPVSSEAKAAVESMGMRFAKRVSGRLSRQMIAGADAIYAMTNSHLRAVLAIEPSARSKTFLLDPAGRDIPDPIGGSQRVYTDTAQRIREIIAQRISEHRL